MKNKKVLIVIFIFVVVAFFFKKGQDLLVRMIRSNNPSDFSMENIFDSTEDFILGEVQFFDKTVTLYYDETQVENNGLYYSAGNGKVTQNEQFSVEDSNHNYRFYADFYNQYDVYVNGELIHPNSEIKYIIGKNEGVIPIYFLEKSKEINVKRRGDTSDYTFTCLSIGFCQKTVNFDLDELSVLMEKWNSVSLSELGLTYNDFSNVVSIMNSWYKYDFLSGRIAIECIDLYSCVNNGRQYIIYEQSNQRARYFELTDEQTRELKDLLS